MDDASTRQRARIRTTVWILAACAVASFVGFFAVMSSHA
jgi:type VI protein secretion system component VasF